MSLFSETDYEQIHALAFRDSYPGYKPEVIEIPNGDGKADAVKRYAHVGLKYFREGNPRDQQLRGALEEAHSIALRAGAAIGLPPQWMPDIRYSMLRILEYPPGAGSNLHRDFDLFTLMMYRDQPDRFVAREPEKRVVYRDESPLSRIQRINAQAHLGELGEAIGLGSATPHEVLPSEKPQRSIVYFAIPDHDTRMPSGETVREWLNERMARSRTQFTPYR